MFMGPRHWFQGMNSASLCSLAGRYENPIPPRCLAPIDFLKIPALQFEPQRRHSTQLLYYYYASFTIGDPDVIWTRSIASYLRSFCIYAAFASSVSHATSSTPSFLPPSRLSTHWQPHRVHILVEMKQGQCICPLSWSVHSNFSGEGKCNERGWACTPHPHQPGQILPSSLNVRQKAAVATLCTLWAAPLSSPGCWPYSLSVGGKYVTDATLTPNPDY